MGLRCPFQAIKYCCQQSLRGIGAMSDHFKRLCAVGVDGRCITMIDTVDVALALLEKRLAI
jgi:hypothetical protein